MIGCNGEAGTLVNSFALVSYLPQPLGGFLDSLRNELVSECRAKAHLTVLPPRPLDCASQDAWYQLLDTLQDFQPFRVKLGEIQIFPVTQVIYLSITEGYHELLRLHAALNAGRVSFQEPFEFHPHVTLAQDLDQDRVVAAVELAAGRWHAFLQSRTYIVDRLTFVQNTLGNRWKDLCSVPLTSGVPAR
ncbi:MAG TPA: 2'-5' RNA ligase family protein [Bryobacteraceae bacterium]|nr:2'-5' RNA ligase family protein [Bryobacteraceae bacterium]